MNGVQLWPRTASDVAGRVDVLVIASLIVAGLIIALVLALVVTFAVRYRRGSAAPRGALPDLIRREVEVGWTFAILALSVFLFAWASTTLLGADPPAEDAVEIHVIAKQWMWKAEHPNGAREIDALHLPRGENIRLIMTSQDVIHSFFVPAFRIKQDVLPGRLTELRFRATEVGEYHLFCAEFCGTLHARMGGRIVVMEPEDYARWRAAQPEGDDLGREGAALFVSLGCAGCHVGSSAIRAPGLGGIYDRVVHLADGRQIRADEAYIRDSILQPRRDVVAGYEPLMPSFAGIVDDADLQRLVAYIRSLEATPPARGAR